MSDQLLLIDLSGLAHMIFHVSGNEPDPSFVSNQLISRVRALAASHPHAAICCDSGKSFRADIDPTYKAQRDTENRAPLRHQMDVACETLKKDGFPVWRVPGFEADDLIATATAKAVALDADVLIASSDKDLLALVSDRVSVKSFVDGLVRGPADVKEKFGVTPAQMPDLLALMGDASDNIKGAEKIGKVIGAKLLKDHGTLANVYAAMAKGVVPGITPAMRTNLMAFKDRWPTVAQLVALRTDVPEGDGFMFAEIATERSAPPMTDEPANSEADMEDALPTLEPAADGGTPAAHPPSIPNGAETSGRASKDAVTAAGVVSRLPQSDAAASVPNAGGSGQQPSEALIAAPPPPEWELQLQPRSYRDLRVFAMDAHNSRKFLRNFGSSEAAIMAVMSGRELGVPAMASLRGFHSVEDGPPMPNADLVRSIILKSGKVEYFEPTERTATAAEFVIKRVGRPEVKLRYTIEEGRTAYGFDVPMTDKERQALEYKWQKSGWGKNPADMCVARSSMKLGRLVCPDVCAGLYAKEEFD